MTPKQLDIADRPMMVVDLFSGSYVDYYVGHEALNLERDKKDGRYYGYCPPKDNVDITSLGAPRHAKSIRGVTVVYVRKQTGTNDREVIAFCENATVHSKPVIDKSLNRHLGKDKVCCSYTIESDTMVNLMSEESKFVIKINDYNNKMFRMQRFYKGTYPELDHKLFEYLRSCLSRRDADDDFSFQSDVQDVDESGCAGIGDNSKKEPDFAAGSGSVCVVKKAAVSKQALVAAGYKCAGNHDHITFRTTRGKPYMEGHHLIPCTYTNARHYWDKDGVNIDCLANIVCLCPTCHRLVHYGESNAKRTLLEKLYNESKEKLADTGITLTLTELLNLYSVE